MLSGMLEETPGRLIPESERLELETVEKNKSIFPVTAAVVIVPQAKIATAAAMPNKR